MLTVTSEDFAGLLSLAMQSSCNRLPMFPDQIYVTLPFIPVDIDEEVTSFAPAIERSGVIGHRGQLAGRVELDTDERLDIGYFLDKFRLRGHDAFDRLTSEVPDGAACIVIEPSSRHAVIDIELWVWLCLGSVLFRTCLH